MLHARRPGWQARHTPRTRRFTADDRQSPPSSPVMPRDRGDQGRVARACERAREHRGLDEHRRTKPVRPVTGELVVQPHQSPAQHCHHTQVALGDPSQRHHDGHPRRHRARLLLEVTACTIPRRRARGRLLCRRLDRRDRLAWRFPGQEACCRPPPSRPLPNVPGAGGPSRERMLLVQRH